MSAAMAEHWGLDDPVGCLSPEQELEDIELGFRVSWWLIICALDSLHPDPWGNTLTMVAQVAQSARELDVPTPAEWIPEECRT